MKTNHVVVSCYLMAIVAANFIIGKFGFNGLIVTSFALIPFDLFARDILHDRWEGKSLKLKMMALIASGSVLSYLLNSKLEKIAIASFVAFASAGIIDTAIYQVMKNYSSQLRMNTSNALSSIADSLVFTSIVFGFDLLSVGQQSAVKFAGGAVWVFLYSKYWRKYVVLN